MRIKCPLEDSEVGHTIVDKCWHFDFTYERCTAGFITVTDTQMTTKGRILVFTYRRMIALPWAGYS